MTIPDAEIETLAEEVLRKTAALPDSERFVLGIAGVPGAGKTTFAKSFTKLLNQLAQTEIAIGVPMDGFHLSNDELIARQLLPLKGIPSTFDANGFVTLVKRLHESGRQTVSCPSFDRTIESTVPDSIVVSPHNRIAVVEGNYLLLAEEPWCQLSHYFAETWFVEENMDTVRARLIERHQAAGKSAAEALEKVNSTDLPNARLVKNSSGRATRTIHVERTHFNFGAPN